MPRVLISPHPINGSSFRRCQERESPYVCRSSNHGEKWMRLIPVLIAAISVCVSPAAFAQAAPASAPAAAAAAVHLAAGTKVFDKAGEELGTIEAIQGGNAIVPIAGTRVALPAAAFSNTANGVAIPMTKAELTAAAQKAGAQSAPPAAAGTAK
ncbi:MAG: hypothetical protein JF593_06695 [Novosphingobium sp.]|nr:hypothetical protein [Novosphingobium sp.]